MKTEHKKLYLAFVFFVGIVCSLDVVACSPIPEPPPYENESMEQYRERRWMERLQSKEIKHILQVKVIKTEGENWTSSKFSDTWPVYVKTLRVYKGKRPRSGVLRMGACHTSAKPGDVLLITTNDNYGINFSSVFSGKEETDALIKASNRARRKSH